MFHFRPNPRPPASVRAVTPGHAVDSSAIIMIPGVRRYAVALASCRNAMASRFSRPNIHGGRENLEAIAFLQEANATAYRRTPGIMMIAEESTAWPGVTARTDDGGLGFGLKWNMGWMNDTLRYLAEQPINRRYHHHEVTFSLVYAFSEHFLLPLSHDEVVHGKRSLIYKMPGDQWQQEVLREGVDQ